MSWLKNIFSKQASEPNNKPVVVVGLGNPGSEYNKTRHNVGREIVRRFGIASFSTNDWSFSRKLNALTVDGFAYGYHLYLMLPETFMNLSGRSVKSLVRQLAVPEIIVVHDDLDLPIGEIKISFGRSAGGHKGVDSIIKELGTSDFARVRVGIGRPVVSGSDYVLAKFSPAETLLMEETYQKAGLVLEAIITTGCERAMNEFNKK